MNFTGCIECGSLVIENEALHLCASCAGEQRKQDRQAKKNALKKPKQIAKFSEKKAEKILPYAVLRRQTLKERPVCEINIKSICEGVAEELHHCSTSELDFLDMDTVKTACRPCHRYTETMMSAEERRRKGLLIDPVNVKFIEPHKI